VPLSASVTWRTHAWMLCSTPTDGSVTSDHSDTLALRQAGCCAAKLAQLWGLEWLGALGLRLSGVAVGIHPVRCRE
jgi:hypothetical protein